MGPGGSGALCDDENSLERAKKTEMVIVMNKKLSESSMLFETIINVHYCSCISSAVT